MNSKPDSFEEIIWKSVAETIENMAFEEVVLEGIVLRTDFLTSSRIFWASVTLSQPEMGTLTGIFPFSLISRFAASIYSLPVENLESSQILDNLGEIMNILSGRLLTRRIPSADPPLFTLPQIGEGLCPLNFETHRTLSFLVGEERFLLVVPKKFWGSVS